MEPTKFEQRIKERLEQREIQPSEASWNVLQTKLQQEKKPVKPTRLPFLYWMAAAAVVVLMITLGVKFSGEEEAITPSIELVNSAKERKEEQQTPSQKNTIVPTAPIKIADRKKESKKTPRLASSTTAIKKTIQSPSTEPEKAVAIQEVQEPELVPTDVLINEKIIAVVKNVQELEKNAINLTDAEVDSLLRKAQEEILNQQYNRFDQSIDAMALLDEVEYEIDATIKNKLFEALKQGFREVRTAVAERNQ